jgi:hypothetical protein
MPAFTLEKPLDTRKVCVICGKVFYHHIPRTITCGAGCARRRERQRSSARKCAQRKTESVIARNVKGLLRGSDMGLHYAAIRPAWSSYCDAEIEVVAGMYRTEADARAGAEWAAAEFRVPVRLEFWVDGKGNCGGQEQWLGTILPPPEKEEDEPC